MYSTVFWYKYPELAEIETRSFVIEWKDRKISEWEYIIQELYCTDKICNCRKVSFNVVWPDNQIYYLDYWFEKSSFYKIWWKLTNSLADEMSWLSINDLYENPKDIEWMFDIIKIILEDKKYISRLKKHYELMKKDIEWYEDLDFVKWEWDFDNIIYLWN